MIRGLREGAAAILGIQEAVQEIIVIIAPPETVRPEATGITIAAADQVTIQVHPEAAAPVHRHQVRHHAAPHQEEEVAEVLKEVAASK